MNDTAPPNAAQIAYWNDRAARTWTAFQERLDRSFAGITPLVLGKAAAAPGETVLDIGCGCGETTLALARAVGAAGRVRGVDVSLPMAARARERLAGAGLDHATVEVDDAASHRFEPGAADLLFSRFGVMFFDDPAAAFANLRRAMRPGGRLAFACWRPMTENPWMGAPLAAGRALLPPEPPPEPDAPGPFAFADAGRVRAILAAAGWRDVATEPADVAIRFAPAGRMEDAVAFAMNVGPLSRAVAEATDETRHAVAAAVASALRPFDGADGIALPGAVWLVTARP